MGKRIGRGIRLEDMKKAKPEEMTSDIARSAFWEYKEDPAIMDKTKEWIRYNFADQFDQLNEEHEKEIKKLKEESEEREKKLREESLEREKRNLENEKKSFARKLLSSGKLTNSEIAGITGLDEKTIKELAQTE